MSKTNKILLALLAIVFVVSFVFASTLTAFAAEVEAKNLDNTIYSDILEDLGKDPTFNVNNYPQKANDYSLELFQVAESNDKELFVYLYQPSGDKVTATEIRLSQSIEENFSAKDYSLKLLSRNGTLAKYLVENLTVLGDVVRYYEIVQVARPFNAALGDSLDHVSGATQTVSTVPYAVSKLFTVTTLNGSVTYTEKHAQTIVVTSKFVGFVRYDGGFDLCSRACDSHFVAFSTDLPIDKLIRAKLSYTHQVYTKNSVTFSDPTEFFGDKTVIDEDIVSCEEQAQFSGKGLFSKTYTWKRIETVNQFLNENLTNNNVYSGSVLDVKMGDKLTDAAKQELETKQWVLRFEETPYTFTPGEIGAYSERSSIIEDVTILELTFETLGNVYHLGVVDNKQSGSRDPVAVVDPIQDQIDLFKKMGESFLILLIQILLLIVAVVLVVIAIKYLVRWFKNNEKHK